MTPHRLSATAAVLLLLSGCAGTSEEETAAKALSDAIVADQVGGVGESLKLERAEADCIGSGFVEEIGIERLQKYGLLSEDLETGTRIETVSMSEKDADAAASVLVGCTDVGALMSEAMGDVDARTKACIEKVLTDEALEELFSLVFQGKQAELTEQFMAPLMECSAGS